MKTKTNRFYAPASWHNRPLRIAIIGAGGSGSEVVDVLARLHGMLIAIGHPSGIKAALIDNDTVSESNVGRQRFLVGDIGKPKAEVLADRYSSLLGFPISSHVGRVTRNSQRQELGEDFDLIITCVDNAKMRVKLARFWHNKPCNAIWQDCGNSDVTGQVIFGHLGLAPEGTARVPNAYDLFPSLDVANDDEAPSCSVIESITRQEFGVNKWVGTIVLSMLWSLLRHGYTTEHGSFFDARHFRSTPLPIAEDQWLGMGYDSLTGCNVGRAA